MYSIHLQHFKPSIPTIISLWKIFCCCNGKNIMNTFWLWMASGLWVIWGPISQDVKLFKLWVWRALLSEKWGAPQCSLATYQNRRWKTSFEYLIYALCHYVNWKGFQPQNISRKDGKPWQQVFICGSPVWSVTNHRGFIYDYDHVYE